MKYLTTYLHFNGNCRAAMGFYKQCFGGELNVMAMPDASGKPSTAPGAAVMHSQLDRDGKPILMASDGAPGADKAASGSNFSVAIECSTPDEVDTLFKALSKNGKVNMPPGDMPWGRFGMCADSFGVSWMLTCPKTA